LLNERSSGIIDNLNKFTYHILGCGAIGSSAAIQLVRVGADNLHLYDMDKVEIENIGVSHYIMRDIGKQKVKALQLHIEEINPKINLTIYDGKFDYFKYDLTEEDVVILAFDNMSSRLEAVEAAITKYGKPGLIIDGRMGAEHYQQYNLLNPTLKEYEATWYSDAEGDPEPCNAKATSYCANMSGAFITNAIRKIAADIPVKKEFFFNFPGMFLASSAK
tara:strand:- start:5363 stop:6019 length:657 start_codon:yes stop_codon:yes gene_type:complete